MPKLITLAPWVAFSLAFGLISRVVERYKRIWMSRKTRGIINEDESSPSPTAEISSADKSKVGWKLHLIHDFVLCAMSKNLNSSYESEDPSSRIRHNLHQESDKVFTRNQTQSSSRIRKTSQQESEYLINKNNMTFVLQNRAQTSRVIRWWS
ncbi:hypothetical protein JTE90_003133 [Oedothorax gibbosus]|uniref:Uncharacterized protein n=1 Tax=Oedothorax gibbosus TaxID=931172 RepID=A0AAV6VF16_9ARAC|nr:hypothetical protein JTE90_003133 [Oedothorax gibbosus]